ncbi:MAG: SRPBCC family protein [Myxococcales bacterium]|jgi:ribosome-associated toxin RatA of RatAB toxin-antitoxin module
MEAKMEHDRHSNQAKRALAAFLLCAVLAAPAAAQNLAQDATRSLINETVRAGHIDSSQHGWPGSKVKMGRAVALVDGSIDEVQAIVSDYASYRGFLPHCKTSKVLSQRGASALMYLEIEVLNGASTLWMELKASAKKSESPTRRIEVKMRKGNVSAFDAVWELTPMGDAQTLVTFQLMVDPDLPVPSGLLSDENQKSARRTIRAVRKELARRRGR